MEALETMDIGEVAAISGLPASTLRFYEARGLIKSIGRHGLRRVFKEDILRRLEFIALGRRAGFSLDEIAGMFGKDGLPDLPRDVLHRKADELDGRIRELIALRDTLRHVADCSAPSHMECPTFKRLIGIAQARAVNASEKPDIKKSRAK